MTKEGGDFNDIRICGYEWICSFIAESAGIICIMDNDGNSVSTDCLGYANMDYDKGHLMCRNVIEQNVSLWFMGKAIHSRVNVDVASSFYNGKLVSPGNTSCILSMRNLVNKFYSGWSNKYTISRSARFSVINRFASFHGKGQADGIQLAAYALRPSPKRYVTAVLMSKNLPKRYENVWYLVRLRREGATRVYKGVVEPTGLDLPAERGLSEAEDVVDVEREGFKLLRVGVDGPEGGLIVGEFIFPGVCSQEPGVEACVFWEGLVVLSLEEVAGDGRDGGEREGGS
nr:hypothetical protein [Tanacetum cinerariifolium]